VVKKDNSEVSDESSLKRYVVDQAALPDAFPTHRHSPEFWEALGRAVATFGFLEEVIGKAIFAFTATKPLPPEEAQAEFERWLPTLERALSDPLGGLIDSYAKAVRANQNATTENFQELVDDLRKAAAVRNVICHGSWRPPDPQGRALPLYVTRTQKIFQTEIDVAFLVELHRHAAELACSVMDTVTHMGWQFPGSEGPGRQILGSVRPL
jgi:hypothetical protein